MQSSEAPLAYQSLTALVAASLRERIFNGTYGPGTWLNISNLAKDFRTSPVPVREALRSLETDLLVEFHANKGVMVSRLTYEKVRELYLIRTPLEETAAIEACRCWKDKGQLAAVEATLKEMKAAENTDRWHTLHDAFHRELYALSGLPQVQRLAELLRSQLRPYTKLYLNGAKHKGMTHAEHVEMAKCLRARDEAGITSLVRQHLARPREIILDAMAEKAQGAARATQGRAAS